jgi:hypothetical protein
MWQDRVVVELVDPSGPELCGRLLAEQDWLSEDSLSNLVGQRETGYFLLSTGDELVDGQVVDSERGAVQLYLPSMTRSTEKARFSLLNPELHLDIRLDDLEATFTAGSVEARVRGECVRVLAAYALRRSAYTDASLTWLSRPDAHQLWKRLGGNKGSPEARIAWERGKVRSQLNKQNVADTQSLFEVGDRSGGRMCRLKVSRGHLTVRGKGGHLLDPVSLGI